jgi:peptidoglycan/xylan/chitin deacetylase (PgdA/CDA1 family)
MKVVHLPPSNRARDAAMSPTKPGLPRALLAWALATLIAAVSAGISAAPVATASQRVDAASGASNAGSLTKPTPAAGDSPPTSSPPPTRVFYRPIGCVRRGPSVAYRSGPHRKVVALSFDDGPAQDTPAFVRMLEAKRVTATFFMIGNQVTTRYGSTLRRELRDGDALGDHSYTHPDLVASGDVYGQLHHTLLAIRRLTGYTPCVFRPPYGDYDQSVINTAKSLGLATILWNVDPSDWALPGVSAIEQRVLAQVRPGSIILSHDGGGPRGETLVAYPRILRALRQRGYRFETVPQLLGFHAVYRRCVKQCEGEQVPGPLPQGAIILR